MSEAGPTPPRPRCRFYGMHALPEFGALLTQGGNQCGLIIESYSPCRMEVAGLEVDFEKCEFKDSGRAAEFAKFQAREFVPAKSRNTGNTGVEYQGGPRGQITLRVNLEPGMLLVEFQPGLEPGNTLPAVVVLEFPNGQLTTFNAETGEMMTTIYPPAKLLTEPAAKDRTAHGPRTRP